MTNYTIINPIALKKALKPDMKKGTVMIQRKGGNGYVCNGCFIVKMPENYLNEFVQPVARHDMPADGSTIVCKSGSWSDGGADLEKMLVSNAAKVGHTAENLDISVQTREKKKRCLSLYAVNGQLVALDSVYTDIIDDSTYKTYAKGNTMVSPIVVTKDETLEESSSAVLVLPVKLSAVERDTVERLQKLASCVL